LVDTLPGFVAIAAAIAKGHIQVCQMICSQFDTFAVQTAFKLAYHFGRSAIFSGTCVNYYDFQLNPSQNILDISNIFDGDIFVKKNI